MIPIVADARRLYSGAIEFTVIDDRFVTLTTGELVHCKGRTTFALPVWKTDGIRGVTPPR